MTALPFIIVVGFMLRIWGIDFGLPFLYHADEPIIVNHALAYGTGDLNPHFFKIPPLVSYLLFVCYGVYYLVGGFQGVAEFQNLFFDNPSSFYLIARIVFGALLGTATIYLLYRLVKKFFSSEAALLSAFFLSLVFIHVRDSHFIYADIPLVFVLVACFFPILNILDNGRMKNYVILGLLAGLAVAIKYNGVFIFIPFAVAHFLGRGFKLNLGFFVAGVVSVLMYSVLNPYTWLDAGFFFRELLGQGGSTGFVGLVHHLTFSLIGGLGLPLVIISIFGLVLAQNKKKWVIGSFVISYYFLLCFFSQPYERYVLPIVPFLIFFAADLLNRFKLPRFVIWLLAFLIISPSLIKVVLCDQILANQDIRNIAKNDFESRIDSGAKVALDVPQFMPRLNFSLDQLKQKMEDLQTSSAQKKRIERLMNSSADKRYNLFFLADDVASPTFLFSKPLIPFQVEELKKNGIQYIFVLKISDNHSGFYEDLKKSSELVNVYSPYKNKSRDWAVDSRPITGAPFTFEDLLARERNGHIIEVYKLN